MRITNFKKSRIESVKSTSKEINQNNNYKIDFMLTKSNQI